MPLKHLTLQGTVLHTLEVTEEQKVYFETVLYQLRNQPLHPGLTFKLYGQAFRHLTLLINQGEERSELERYVSAKMDID